MATHDYDIANQSGANFRTDLNNCLDAIVSNNSNSSDPSTTFAYMWWVDTSNNVLKLRNSANNAWITLPMSITASNTITPTLNMGTGAEEDVKIVFDGNAKDFYIALDDSADKLIIGEGSTVGTNPILTITDDSIVIGDGAAVDTSIVFDGNAQDFYIGLDDSADDLLIGKGSAVGTTPAIAIDENLLTTLHGGLAMVGTTPTLTIGDGGEEDTKIVFDGNAQDYYIGLDDSADTLVLGNGTAVGTEGALFINNAEQVSIKTDLTEGNIASYDGLFTVKSTEVTTHNVAAFAWEHSNTTTDIEQRIAWAFGDDGTADSYSAAGYIGMGKEGSWNIDSQRDSYMAFGTALDNGLSERVRINHNGTLSNKSANNLVRIEAQKYLLLGDDSSVDLFLGTAGSTLLSVYEGGSGSGALVWLNYSESSGGNFVKSGGALNFSSSDTDGQICVIKSANSHTATVKNRSGVARNFAIAMYGAKIDSANG